MKGLTKVIAIGVLTATTIFGLGCNGQIIIGGRDYNDLTKSKNVAEYNQRADKLGAKLDAKLDANALSRSGRISVLSEAIPLHGGLGNLETMNEYIQEMISLDSRMGEIYEHVGKKYEKLHK